MISLGSGYGTRIWSRQNRFQNRDSCLQSQSHKQGIKTLTLRFPIFVGFTLSIQLILLLTRRGETVFLLESLLDSSYAINLIASTFLIFLRTILPGSLYHFCPVAKTFYDWIPFCGINRLTNCTINAVLWIVLSIVIAVN
jgi:hypothetical protein